jgi:hypothetical protein
VDGDGVGFVADLELEGEQIAAKDLEGACVGGGEWWVGGGGAQTKTKGAERSSGGIRGGGVVAGAWEREPEREDCKFLRK